MFIKNTNDLLACDSLICKIFGITKNIDCDKIVNYSTDSYDKFVCYFGKVWMFLFGPNMNTLIARLVLFILLYTIPLIIYNTIKNKINKNKEVICDGNCRDWVNISIIIIITLIICFIIAYYFNK